MKASIILITLPLWVAGCYSPGLEGNPTADKSAKVGLGVVPHAVVAMNVQASLKGGDEPFEVVIRTEKEFDDLWTRIGADKAQISLRGNIEFAKEMAALIYLGYCPHPYNRAEISSTVEYEREVVISFCEKLPEQMALPGAVSHPFTLISFPRTDKKFRFVRLG